MKTVQKLIVDFLEVEPRSLIRLRSKSPKRIRFYVFNRRFVLSNRYKSVRIGVCRFGEKNAPRSLVGHTSSNSSRIFGKKRDRNWVHSLWTTFWKRNSIFLSRNMKKTQIFLDRKLREQRIPPFRIRQNSTILDQFIIFDAVRRCFWSRLWIRICLSLLFICTTQPSATYLQLSIHPLPAQPSEPALSVHCVCAANLSQSSTQPVKAVIPIPQAHVSPFQSAILTYCVENKM